MMTECTPISQALAADYPHKHISKNTSIMLHILNLYGLGYGLDGLRLYSFTSTSLSGSRNVQAELTCISPSYFLN